MSELIRAGDVRAWLLCKRRAWFDHNPPGDLPTADAFELLVQQAGYAHEAQVKQRLADTFGPVAEARDAEHTIELIAAKTPIIYQAEMIDEKDRLVGKPDFLILRDDDHYQVADAKLALSIKKKTDIKIQLAIYRRLFNTLLPGLVYLGSGEVAEVGPEMDQKCQAFIEGMQNLLASTQPPEASFGFTKCSACPYQQTCVPEFEYRQELSLLYDIREPTAVALKGQGIESIPDLANTEASSLADVPYLKGNSKKQTAIWRAQSYLSGNVRQVAPVDLPEGVWLHFDIESNPLADQGLGAEVYLWGLLLPDYSDRDYIYFWSNGGEQQDYRVWCDFLACLDMYRQQFSKCVIAHYSPYEITQIKAYAARYGMQQNATVRWLLGEDSPLFDLQKSVKESLVLPLKGYGLKAICKDSRLVNFQWALEESGSQWSVVRYIDFLQTSDAMQREIIKQEILSYNRDDVKATRALELWLKSEAFQLAGK